MPSAASLLDISRSPLSRRPSPELAPLSRRIPHQAADYFSHEWGWSRPLALHVSYNVGENRYEYDLPIGYARMSPWPELGGTSSSLVASTLLATQPQPGLSDIVQRIRREAGVGEGPVVSIADRLAVRRGIMSWFQAQGIRFRENAGAFTSGPFLGHSALVYSAEQTLALREGVCRQFAVLGGSLLHELGIPFAMIENSYPSTAHAWGLIELQRAHTLAELAPETAETINLPCEQDFCQYAELDLNPLAQGRPLETVMRHPFQAGRQKYYSVTQNYRWVPSWSVPELPESHMLRMPETTIITYVGRPWLTSSPYVQVRGGRE